MDDITKVRFKLTGIAPLLMHSARLADPLEPTVAAMKAITSKSAKKKTDDDHAELARLEWVGGLNLDADGKPVIKAAQVESLLVEAGRRTRKGKDVQRSVFVDYDSVLAFDGSKKFDEESASRDPKFRLRCPAKVPATGAVVMRCRPIFRGWSAIVEVNVVVGDDMSRGLVVEMMEAGGRLIGIGDWRPKYGRFLSEVVS